MIWICIRFEIYMFIFMQWHNILQVEVWVRWLRSMVFGHGDESSIPFNDILKLVLNDNNMITCVVNDYKMTTYFYLSMWTIHIVVLDKTWHMSCWIA